MRIIVMYLSMLYSLSIFANVTPEQIKEVMSYRESGDAPVLFDSKLTSEISENNPTDELSSIEKDQKGIFWMKYFIPRNLEDTTYHVIIKKGPVPVKTKEITLKTNKNGSYGYRTWVSHKYTKTGKYKIEVYYNEKVIKSLDFIVK